MLSLLVGLTLLLYSSSFNKKMPLLTLRWLLLLNKESSSSQRHTIQFPMDTFLHSSLNQELYLLKLITGPEVMSVLELLHIIQVIIKLFLVTEENTLIKLLFLLQVLNKVTHSLRVSQKWDNLMNPKTFLFIKSTINWLLIKITTMDGTIEPETCSTTLQLLHTREKDLTSTHLSMSHSWDKINNMVSVMIQLKSNTSLQTKTSLLSHMLTKLL